MSWANLGRLLGHFGITLESPLAYEGHFGSLWGDSGTTLRFFLAYGGAFEVTLGSLLAYGGPFGMLLDQFGTSLRLLLACECDFGLLWGRSGTLWGDFRSAFKVLGVQSGVASSTLERLWGNFRYI